MNVNVRLMSSGSWFLTMVLTLLSSSIFWGQVEFRAIGGPGIDRGEVVLPHSDGAFLLGTTQPQEADLLRPYIVHYSNDLTVDWSVVLPSPHALEWIVDGRLDTLNNAQILTQRLNPDGTYSAAIHNLTANGETVSTVELDGIASNFIPAKLCEWQGQIWVVGHSGNRLIAADLALSTVLEWGGSIGQEDFISDVLVHDNILIVVGRRLENDVSRAAAWGLYPLGQIAFEIITPNEEGWTESRMDGIDVRNNSIRMLRTFHYTDDNGTALTSHDFLALNVANGEAGAFWAAGEGEEGRDLIWTNQGVAKLIKSNNVESLDEAFLIVHVSASSSYISQGHFGTSFEEDPSRLSLGPDGSVWAAGSTRGVLDGSWSACLLRLDSLGPLGGWSNGNFGFGVVNDPTLLSFSAMDPPAETQESWGCYPNPTSDVLHLAVPGAKVSAAGSLSWTIRDAGGRVVDQGSDVHIDTMSLHDGSYILEGESLGQRFSLPFVKTSR